WRSRGAGGNAAHDQRRLPRYAQRRAQRPDGVYDRQAQIRGQPTAPEADRRPERIRTENREPRRQRFLVRPHGSRFLVLFAEMRTHMISFTPNDEQQLIIETVRRYATERVRPA